MSIFHLFGNLGRMSFNKSVEKNIVATFGAPVILFTFIGARTVGVVDVYIDKTLIGVILLFYSGLILLDIKLRFNPSTFNAAVGGVLYDFFSGLRASLFRN